MNVEKRIFRALGANLIGQLILVAYRLVLPPLLLRSWGATGYADWLMIASFAVVFSLADLGSRQYVSNRLTQTMEAHDSRALRRVLHTGVALSLALPLALLGLTIAAMAVLGPARVLGLSGLDPRTALLALAVLSLQQIATIPQGILIGIYRAAGQQAKGSMVANATQLLQLAFMAAGFYFGAGVTGIAALQVVPFLAATAFAAKRLSAQFPEFALFSIRDFDPRIARELIHPSLHFFAIQLAQLLSVQGVVFSAGHALSASDLSVFVTLRTMGNLLSQLIGVFALACWPELTRLEFAGNHARLRALVRLALRGTLLAAVGASVVFHFGGEQIHTLWVGNRIPYDPHAMDLLLLYGIQLSCWSLHKSLLMAVNRHERMTKLLLLSAGAMVALSWPLGRIWGIPGVALAMIASEVLLPFWAVPAMTAAFWPELKLRDYWNEVWPAALAIGAALLSPFLAPVALAGLGARLAHGWKNRARATQTEPFTKAA